MKLKITKHEYGKKAKSTKSRKGTYVTFSMPGQKKSTRKYQTEGDIRKLAKIYRLQAEQQQQKIRERDIKILQLKRQLSYWKWAAATRAAGKFTINTAIKMGASAQTKEFDLANIVSPAQTVRLYEKVLSKNVSHPKLKTVLALQPDKWKELLTYHITVHGINEQNQPIVIAYIKDIGGRNIMEIKAIYENEFMKTEYIDVGGESPKKAVRTILSNKLSRIGQGSTIKANKGRSGNVTKITCVMQLNKGVK